MIFSHFVGLGRGLRSDESRQRDYLLDDGYGARKLEQSWEVVELYTTAAYPTYNLVSFGNELHMQYRTGA